MFSLQSSNYFSWEQERLTHGEVRHTHTHTHTHTREAGSDVRVLDHGPDALLSAVVVQSDQLRGGESSGRVVERCLPRVFSQREPGEEPSAKPGEHREERSLMTAN